MNLPDRFLSSPPLTRALIIALGGSVLALLVAWISQYGFNLHPCELCILQRYPYMAVIIVALIAVLIRQEIIKVGLLMLVTLLLLVETGIAAYHTGVEQGVFSGPAACSSELQPGMSLEEWKAMIMNSQVVACNQPAIEIMGITMASANVIYALALSIICMMALWRYRKLRYGR